jgi:hypothetical protein
MYNYNLAIDRKANFPSPLAYKEFKSTPFSIRLSYLKKETVWLAPECPDGHPWLLAYYAYSPAPVPCCVPTPACPPAPLYGDRLRLLPRLMKHLQHGGLAATYV